MCGQPFPRVTHDAILVQPHEVGRRRRAEQEGEGYFILQAKAGGFVS
jgi:hypothetical protein